MDQRARMFLGILLAVMGILASASFVGAQVQTSVGSVSDCGYSTSCYATGPYGIVVSVSVNATVVKSNGSLSFSVSLSNPTDHSVNISMADSWYLPGLSESATCGYAPYAYEVFRGYYNLTDVSTGQNVLRTVDPVCIFTPRPATLSFPPKSICVFWCTFGQLYATDGGTGKQGDVYIGGVTSLWSSQPGVYTMVAGDEWGTFLILHFSVVPDGPSPT